MKNNLLSEKLVYTGDTRTPTHLHLVRYTPDEVHEYTADSLPPIEPQFSEKGMIWLQVHGLKETETVRQVCDRFGIDFLVMQDILNADHPTKAVSYTHLPPPRRVLTSIGFTPAAFIVTSTSPLFGTGAGTVATAKRSVPPKRSRIIAFITVTLCYPRETPSGPSASGMRESVKQRQPS